MLSAVLILGIVLISLYVISSIRTYYALRDFGGHWSAGWSRLWLLQTQGSGEMNKRFTAINKEHGEWRTVRSVYRIGVHKNIRFAVAA